jgi:DNA-binding response OmpR family regulator
MPENTAHKRQMIVWSSPEMLGESVIRALQKEGYNMVFVASSLELEKQFYGPVHTDTVTDTVLIDGDHAGVSLEEAAEKLRLGTSGSPLLILTSWFSITNMASALLAGFDEYVAKPVGKDELLAVLKNGFAKRKH